MCCRARLGQNNLTGHFETGGLGGGGVLTGIRASVPLVIVVSGDGGC